MPNDFWHELDDGVLPADIFESKKKPGIQQKGRMIDLGIDAKRANNMPRDFHRATKQQDIVKEEKSPREFWPKARKLSKKLLFSTIIILSFGLISISGLKYFGKQSLGEKIAFWNLFKNGKYLVLFQNNTELRASGGFLGSFAVMDLKDGKVEKIYVDTNIYKRDNDFVWNQGNRIEPPSPIKKAFGNDNWWAMRDSNWYVDFSQGADKVAWFYQQEGGEKVDGVIALNTTVMTDLLKLTGPIAMPQYNLTVDNNNFLTEVQYQVEKGYYQNIQGEVTNEPKTVLKDMLPLLMEKVNKMPDKSQLLDFLGKELREKNIMVKFNNDDLQKIALDENWAGTVWPNKKNVDYLQINHSNLGVNKSSLNVSQTAFYSIQKNNGKLTGELSITREHQGTYNWPDGDNVNWTRILVSDGAQLVSAKENNSDITGEIAVSKEADKTVFAFWYKTNVGSKTNINIKYNLPFYVESAEGYELDLQKQSGILGDSYKVQFMDQVIFNGLLDSDKKLNAESQK